MLGWLKFPFWIVTLWAFTGQIASSGAWMRDKGDGFAALSYQITLRDGTSPLRTQSDLYLEYGLRSFLTIGAKGNYAPTGTSEAELFFRLPIRNTQSPAKISFELGIGGQVSTTQMNAFLRTGLSVGRGFELGDRSAWVNVDTALILPQTGAQRFKLDTTLGLSLSPRFQVMGQAFFEQNGASNSLKISPSVTFKPKPDSKTQWVASMTHTLDGATETNFKLGLWRSF